MNTVFLIDPEKPIPSIDRKADLCLYVCLYPLAFIQHHGQEAYQNMLAALSDFSDKACFVVEEHGATPLEYLCRIINFLPPQKYVLLSNHPDVAALPGVDLCAGEHLLPIRSSQKSNENTGLFIARFQPFTSGHMEFIEACLRHCSRLVLVISKAEEAFTPDNPLTAFERWESLYAVYAHDERILNILPLPYSDFKIENMQRLQLLSPVFDCVCSINNQILSTAAYFGYPTHTPHISSTLSATQVRKTMAAGGHWQPMVPAGTVDVLHRHGVPGRMAQLHAHEIRK